MKSTCTGLADLARALQFLNPEPRDCPAIAELLGLNGDFIFQRAANPEPASPMPEFHPAALGPAEEEDQLADLESDSPELSEAESADHDREIGPGLHPWKRRRRKYQYEPRVEPPSEEELGKPVSLTQLQSPASGEMPSFIAHAEEILFPDAARWLPAPEALVSDAQLRALVTALISVPRQGEPDVERLIGTLASGRLPRKIPRKTRMGIVQHVHVLIDSAGPMRLFQADALRALRAMRRVAGVALRSERFTHGPPGDADLAGISDGVLLVLSTLGIGAGELDRSGTESDWRRFAEACRSRGLQTVAMVPYQPSRWPLNLRRCFRLVPWHPPGARARSATAAELRRLASVLSLAAVIDPALLRAARKRVLPETDAGTEIDFAGHPWIAAWNPRVLSLHSHWVVQLRSELARDSELLEAARRLLEHQRPRSTDWARVLFEEELVFIALKSAPGDSIELEAILARVIRSLLGRMNNTATARWALSFLDELPESARQTHAALLLQAVASVLLSTAPAAVAEIVASQNAPWIFTEKTQVGVRWTGQQIVVREPPQDGDTIMEIPATRPRIVIVTDVDGFRRKVLRLSNFSPSGWTRATYLPRLLKTTDGAVHRLDNVTEAWEKIHHSLAAQETIPGVVRKKEASVYLVDIGLLARMTEESVILGGGNLELGVGQEVQVRVLHISEKTNDIWLGLGAITTPPQHVWNQLELCYSSFQKIRGTVAFVGQTGCRIVVMGVNTFLPMNQLAKNDSPAVELLGRELVFQVHSISAERRLVHVTRRHIERHAWRKVCGALGSGARVSGTISAALKGGFDVELRGKIPAFLPKSQFDVVPPKEPEQLVGKTYEFKVVKINEDRRNVIVSRRELVEQDIAEKRARFLQTIEIGTTVKGVVKNIVNFGAFIDLGGMDGLLHLTDMSWKPLDDPNKLVEVGQELELRVLDINMEKGRVSLGLKQTQKNPWEEFEVRFPVGSKVKGRVKNLVPYGAFIEVEGGIEGLVHISDLSSTKPITRPSEVLTIGQEIDVVVLGVIKDEQKISLGVRQLPASEQ